MTFIFINAGHSYQGKPDCGCHYNGIKECEISREIADKLAKILTYNKFSIQVYQQMGENNDSNKQLNKVCQIANASKADIFISIHMNGFSNESAKGTETLYSSGSANGKLLAGFINTELTKPFDNYTLINRGAKVDSRGLAVLKYTNMPAVLTEIGFISNVNEANFIKSHTDEIAQRLANAICKYFNKKPIDYLESVSKHPEEFVLTHIGDGKYDLNVDESLKLSGNKLKTCLDWIKDNYA